MNRTLAAMSLDVRRWWSRYGHIARVELVAMGAVVLIALALLLLPT